MKKSELRQIIKEVIAEKHGVIPNREEYISLTDPDGDWSEEDTNRMWQIEKEAEKNGTIDILQQISYNKHFGKPNNSLGMDKLKWKQDWIRSTKNRITKSGKLNKNSATWLKNQIKRGY